MESDLAEARAAMSADQESLQDKIFELEDQIKEEATKMLGVLDENEQLQSQVQALKVRNCILIPGWLQVIAFPVQDESTESTRLLKERILELEQEICNFQIKTAAVEAQFALDAAEKVGCAVECRLLIHRFAH